MDSQLYFLFGCIRELEVFEAFDHDVAFIRINGLIIRRIQTTILIGNILRLHPRSIILRIRLIVLVLVEEEGDVACIVKIVV